MAFKQFDLVPNHYTGPVIQRIKDFREEEGKRSLAPTVLTVGGLEMLVPRHFGFCFGVERAIHMAFSALERHPGRQSSLMTVNVCLNAALNLALIPVYGVQGAASATAVSFAFSALTLNLATWRWLGLPGGLLFSGSRWAPIAHCWAAPDWINRLRPAGCRCGRRRSCHGGICGRDGRRTHRKPRTVLRRILSAAPGQW